MSEFSSNTHATHASDPWNSITETLSACRFLRAVALCLLHLNDPTFVFHTHGYRPFLPNLRTTGSPPQSLLPQCDLHVRARAVYSCVGVINI